MIKSFQHQNRQLAASQGGGGTVGSPKFGSAGSERNGDSDRSSGYRSSSSPSIQSNEELYVNEFAAGLVANPHQQSGVKESAGFGVASSSNSLDEADLTISSTSISSGGKRSASSSPELARNFSEDNGSLDKTKKFHQIAFVNDKPVQGHEELSPSPSPPAPSRAKGGGEGVGETGGGGRGSVRTREKTRDKERERAEEFEKEIRSNKKRDGGQKKSDSDSPKSSGNL